MSELMTREELEELVSAGDRSLGSSEWHKVDQKAIDLFADATGDHQWIHVDPEQAKQGPFGQTVAHGYLSLSLVPVLLEEVLKIKDERMGLNYGTDRVRFTAPVPSGSEVRLTATLKETQPKGNGLLYKLGVELEVKGQDKPALVGDVLYMTF